MTTINVGNLSGKNRIERRLSELGCQDKARLLYEYCIASDKKVSETIHNLFSIAQHYSVENATELSEPTVLNGIPPFFLSLTSKEKAEYCYDQVIEQLSREALPVTVESLLATKRRNPIDPWSSYAGQFVRRVTIYVCLCLSLMLALGLAGLLAKTEAQWIAFGCLGALVHLLNYALTTTRLQTFELSEARKIWPRLLLGGMFGFVVPWLLVSTGEQITVDQISMGSVAAFFGGYSVRFATGLFERMLSALFPESTAKA